MEAVLDVWKRYGTAMEAILEHVLFDRAQSKG